MKNCVTRFIYRNIFKTTQSHLLVIGVISLFASEQAISTPVDADSFVYTFAKASTGGSQVQTDPEKTFATSSHSLGTNAYAWASLSDASLKGIANNSTRGTGSSVSRAVMFDFLEFSGSSETEDISFELGFDGTLSRLTSVPYNSASYASAITRVSLYDVTDLNNVIDDSFGIPEASIEVLLAAFDDPSILLTPENTGFYGLLDDDISGALPSTSFFLQTVFDETSSLVEIDLSKIIDITVPTNRLLMFGMSQYLVTSNGDADFLGTSTFEFTDLGGSTFNSISGVFSGSTTKAVPEPSTLALFALGGLFTFFRRKLMA